MFTGIEIDLGEVKRLLHVMTKGQLEKERDRLWKDLDKAREIEEEWQTNIRILENNLEEARNAQERWERRGKHIKAVLNQVWAELFNRREGDVRKGAADE